MHVADKETKSLDDAERQQAGQSASALLKEHEELMRVKRRSRAAKTDDSVRNVPAVTDCSINAAPSTEAHDRHSHGAAQEPSQRSKYRVPELGRGLSVSGGGFVDLDCVACSSATVVFDSAKVCVDVQHLRLIVSCYRFVISIVVIIFYIVQ